MCCWGRTYTIDVVVVHLLKLMLSLLRLALLASAKISVTIDSGPIIETTTSLPSATATVNKVPRGPLRSKTYRPQENRVTSNSSKMD